MVPISGEEFISNPRESVYAYRKNVLMKTPTQDHKLIWTVKTTLRLIYHDFYQRIQNYTRPGPVLEIGGGSGNLKSYLKNVTSIDIQENPWLDAVADAQSLPFSEASFSNIVFVDVLHHLSKPINFFREAIRIMRPGGRIVFVEPAMTPVSWIVYKFFHPEPVSFACNPLDSTIKLSSDDPFDSNQAISYLIFERHLSEFQRNFPQIRLIHKANFSILSYLLSGGFRPWSLLPQSLVPALLKMEQSIEKIACKYIGFRHLVVLELTDEKVQQQTCQL